MTTGRMLLLPVGHYAGQWPSGHRIRLGSAAVELTGEEFDIWLRAHGAGGPDRSVWEPEAMHSLLGRGLLASTAADGSQFRRFAAGHRMASLLSGLDDTATTPGRFGIGVPGAPAVAWLEADAHALWTWGPLAPSLWHVCRAMVDGGTPLGGPRGSQQAAVELLAALQVLLRHAGAYLDRCVPVEDAAMTDWIKPSAHVTSEQG